MFTHTLALEVSAGSAPGEVAATGAAHAVTSFFVALSRSADMVSVMPVMVWRLLYIVPLSLILQLSYPAEVFALECYASSGLAPALDHSLDICLTAPLPCGFLALECYGSSGLAPALDHPLDVCLSVLCQ